MSAGVDAVAPFPLEGGRAGDGGGDASGKESAAKPRADDRRSTGGEGATPIPDPSPLQGEGYRPPHGPASGGVARARRLRQEMTVAERLLWAELRKLKMNFRRQVPIGATSPTSRITAAG